MGRWSTPLQLLETPRAPGGHGKPDLERAEGGAEIKLDTELEQRM